MHSMRLLFYFFILSLFNFHRHRYLYLTVKITTMSFVIIRMFAKCHNIRFFLYSWHIQSETVILRRVMWSVITFKDWYIWHWQSRQWLCNPLRYVRKFLFLFAFTVSSSSELLFCKRYLMSLGPPEQISSLDAKKVCDSIRNPMPVFRKS